MTELSSRQRAGYALGMIVGFANLPAAFVPGGEDSGGGPTGPPVAILALSAVLGLAVMALLYQSLRTGRRGWLRTAAVLMILLALLALPGVLTPTVEAWIRVLAGAYVLLTVAALSLLFAPAARRTPSFG
jgi:hypothetical protein